MKDKAEKPLYGEVKAEPLSEDDDAPLVIELKFISVSVRFYPL